MWTHQASLLQPFLFMVVVDVAELAVVVVLSEM